MHFATPIPWWLVALLAAAIGGLAFASYYRPLVRLSPGQRGILAFLRAAVLGTVVVFLCRPVVLRPPAGARDLVVPVLVDGSRSMRVADADGGHTRIAEAGELLRRDLLPELSRHFAVDLYLVGESIAPSSIDRLAADGRRSDLTGVLATVRERYRGRPMAGIVLLSDGGDTGTQPTGASSRDGVPVFAVGLGSVGGPKDREIVGLTAGDPRLDQTSVDLHVSTVSHGFGRAPFDLRVLANGRPLDTRRVIPVADGSPVDEVFTVSPDPLNPTVYTAQIDVAGDEAVPENNARSILVGPVGRKRRLLAIEGAPGFEHSFMTRALARDPGLELDTVVRKGKNDNGQDTFFVQAAAGRSSSLTSGFPTTREALYEYDAIIVANLEGDFFKRAQLQTAADFVAVRGGGLLMLGGRSFAQRGLTGTPLEEVMPIELADRRAGMVRASAPLGNAPHYTVVPTTAGEAHPATRLGSSPEETRKRWAQLPPLAASAPLGGPRPGATVLAVTVIPGGAVYPVVAVQRYGRGRSMVFGGEASWRWRMMRPSSDRTYELFWRQAVRWLASSAPDPVTVAVPESAEQGDAVSVEIDVRDREFNPVSDASVDATLTLPGGQVQPLSLRRDASVRGRLAASLRPEQAGLYRVSVGARRGSTPLGEASRWLYVGGSDREFADPRLNEAFLRRVARQSGGRYLRPSDASELVRSLRSAAPQAAEPERRDLWDQPWAFAVVIALISAEWILRRRWGLR